MNYLEKLEGLIGVENKNEIYQLKFENKNLYISSRHKILRGRVQFPIGGKVREPYKAEPFKLRYRQLKSGREKIFYENTSNYLFKKGDAYVHYPAVGGKAALRKSN